MNGPQPSAAFAAEVTLAWDASSSSGVTGYRVYYGTASGNYPYYQDSGNRTTYTLANLNAGTTYYLAVSAMNSAGLISAYSNEVVYTTATGSSTAGLIFIFLPAYALGLGLIGLLVGLWFGDPKKK